MENLNGSMEFQEVESKLAENFLKIDAVYRRTDCLNYLTSKMGWDNRFTEKAVVN